MIFKSSNDVQAIVQSRSKLKGQQVFLNNDLTKMQRDVEAGIKNEYQQRVSNAEKNIHIKYIQGVPKIVPKN